MEFNTSFESKLEIDSNYEDGAVITSLDFAHNLQFYETPPTVNMDYRPAVDLAIQRHQVLLAVEMAGRRFPKFSENYMKFLDGQLREINFQIAISSSYASGQATSSILKQRQEDAQSHFLLLIAFSETFQDRQWFLQQEVDLSHFRILCERNAKDEKEHQRKELFAGCHSAKVKYFKKMKKLPPEEEAIEQRRFVMQWEFYKVPFKESVALL
ncbi:DNA primase large subunit [Trichinella sp. T9]|nr:DNA primase large subunit [Trichinella sp. T9]